jgi:hypothetical protein
MHRIWWKRHFGKRSLEGPRGRKDNIRISLKEILHITFLLIYFCNRPVAQNILFSALHLLYLYWISHLQTHYTHWTSDK